MKNILNPLLFSIMLIALLAGCVGQQTVKSPKGYDLNNPVKYNMPDALTEISGIAFNKGNADTLYAEQDEDGFLFYFKPGTDKINQLKFGKGGDYEDVAVSNGWVIMLRSDGILFTFPLKDLKNGETSSNKQIDLLAKGEYEGMYADDASRSVYVLCKHCSVEKASQTTTIFNLKLAADGSLSNAGRSTIDIKKIEELTNQTKINFHPSALAKNPQTNEWYVLSSVNKLLVIADSSWRVKEVYALNPAIFHQPEGMAFDKDNNLYISNEGDKFAPGNVLKFPFSR
ncbi:MAG: SdiA-regulated domain-containing protein [Bacteroidota bacterium]|nr:SdiA-regulated domain-containing protein [Bacteroidota bacterium]